MNPQKRVLAVHDISCVGKCSLTVALPIISAAGIECSVLPTAVLSTHTGGFAGFTYRDLTDDVMPIADHWQSLGIKFDAVYTGFLGSFAQIELMIDLFGRLGEGSMLLVDPVMADNGVLYKIFPPDFPAGMKKLCAKADVIVPNITEALFMLGEPYAEPPYTKGFIESLLKKLAGILERPGKIFLTGVCFNRTELGAASYDVVSGEINYSMSERIDGYYHGTGDVFGSALLSALINGRTPARAAEIAVGFTVDSIMRTRLAGTDIRYGVNFEAGLHKLATDVFM
ncbi:MAG: pyridoxamine kinase [Defluviitaleaceae bacterium]|nr:pyridoxamine kinase [Defluviitaleaceae bacterium]